MWLFTVASLRYSRLAISALDRPLATSLTTSTSRGQLPRSSIMLVPAVLALMRLLGHTRPVWALTADSLAGLGILIGIGDSATQLVFWQMGAPGASLGQMAALATRYNSAPGAALIFMIGGLATLCGKNAGVGRALPGTRHTRLDRRRHPGGHDRQHRRPVRQQRPDHDRQLRAAASRVRPRRGDRPHQPNLAPGPHRHTGSRQRTARPHLTR
jgi:hypothetical protein